MRTLFSAVLTLLVLSTAQSVLAQGADAFPVKPVTIIVPIAAGGPTDLETRLYAQKMTELMGKPFLIDFKAGAGSVVGTAFVAKAPADGYTLIVIAGNFTVLPAVQKNLPFNTLKDFAPISLMSEKPQIFIVNPSFPAKNFWEYLAYAKANPGKLNVGATSQGGINHLMQVWLHSLAKAKVTYIPYKAQVQLMADLMGGRLDGVAIGINEALSLAKAGKVRALGTSASSRPKVWPELPTIKEQGVTQFEYMSWVGMGAPAGTPQLIINKLAESFAKTAKSPEVVVPLEADGWVLVGSTPAEFRQLIVAQTERWKKLVDDNGITAE